MIDGPLCVFCGSEFPVELERCPTCGRPWIDQRLSEVAEGVVVPLGDVSNPADTGVDLGPSRRVPLWMIAAGVALVALAAYGAVFSFLLRDDTDAAAAAATSTTTAVPTTAPPATVPETTTTTTTSPSPTTTSTTTTSTTTTTVPPTTTTTLPLVTEGTPIPRSDLSLGAFALGPLRVGSNGTTAIERLAGTFGQPTAIVPLAGGEAGICEVETGRIVYFGGVGAILVGDPGDDVFAGYLYLDEPGHPSEGLETLSGAGIGDTVADVDAVYAGSIVEVADIDGRPHLFILRSSDRRTLLWGPLSGQGDDAVLIGINAPYWCDDGPFVP